MKVQNSVREAGESSAGGDMKGRKVVEHGFKDSTSDPLSVKKNPHPHEINAGAKLGSQSEESSETTFSGESPNGYFVEDEEVEAVFVGKDFHNNRDHAGVDVSRQIGESVMWGTAFQEVTLKAVEPQAVNDKKTGQETPVIEDRRTWSDIVFGGASTIAEAANGKTVDNPITGLDATPFRVFEDVENMGLMVEGESAVVKQKDNKDNWAKEIEDRFAASANKWFGLQEGVDCVESKKQTVSVEEAWKMWIDDDFDYRMVVVDWRSGGLITIRDKNCLRWRKKY
ncbi:hypothetical protein V6N11_024960 [Hibiscus sabdariffa]|uniref:Uncharacterized protein n=1 Tax=Hibiscus sabdariffa TaxID=183260 RepID=A0ABR2QNP3_9ROSI